MFRDGRGTDGELPPNNWPSVLRRPGVDPDHEPGRHPRPVVPAPVRPQAAGLELGRPRRSATSSSSVLEFWLDRGADGFRVDVAHSLVKAPGLPDLDLDEVAEAAAATVSRRCSITARCGTRTACTRSTGRGGRCSTATPPTAILVAEAWVQPLSRLARYVRPDEMHQAFNFEYLDAPWDAAEICARRSTHPWPPTTRSALRPPGCCRITMWCAMSRASGCPATPRGRTVSGPRTRSPTTSWACAGRAPRRC